MAINFVSFLHDLFCTQFKNDPMVVFYPGMKNAVKKSKDSEKISCASEPYPIAFLFFENQQKVHCTTLLIDMLQKAFESRSLFVSPLYLTSLENWIPHAVTFAASEEGHLYIIDSSPLEGMESLLQANLKHIAAKLNEKPIVNRRGDKIHFQPKYIRTNLQQDSCDCWLYSWLYSFKIAQRRDIQAYQDVNGALFLGKWSEVNDFKNKDIILVDKVPVSWKGNARTLCFINKLRNRIVDHIQTKLEAVGDISESNAKKAKKKIQKIIQEQKLVTLF